MMEFFKSLRFKIIIAIIAVLFGIMLYSASMDGASNIPRNLLSMIVTPFQKASSALSNVTGGFFDVFLNAQNHADDNKALRAEVDRLNAMLIDYEKLVDENDQLEKIAGIKNLYPDFEITPAFVTGRDPADRFGSFTIDKGMLHGISLNDPVMSSSGLIGVVSEVSPINARVKTLFSPDTNISSFEISTKELGIISGDMTMLPDGLCKFSVLSETTKVESGQLIVTAGASGKFPKGVPIGTIVEVSPEAHGVTMFATIMPLASISEVTDVEVITNFLGQGSELLDYIEK